jgi:hypothetical protein
MFIFQEKKNKISTDIIFLNKTHSNKKLSLLFRGFESTGRLLNKKKYIPCK